MPIVGTQCPVFSFGQKKLRGGQSIINGEQPSPLQCAGCRLPPTLCRRTNLGCEAVRQCIANGRLPTANWKLEIGNWKWAGHPPPNNPPVSERHAPLDPGAFFCTPAQPM